MLCILKILTDLKKSLYEIANKNMIIPDNETDIDYLYYEAISKTVVQTIEQAKKSPVTIGVHGDWGAGKSSILKMIEGTYGDDESTLCVHFNGWLFQGFEETKTVLIETIISELVKQKKTSKAIADKASELLKRVNWLKLARKSGGLAFTALTGIPNLDQAKDLISGLKNLIGKTSDIESGDIEALLSETSDLLKSTDTDTMPDQIHAFREEFSELLEVAKVERLVVVVDDLDRCLPETAIETLEAIRLFLFVPGSAFVIAADEAMIEYAVKKHFPDLPLSTGPASYARNYLEKLIQVPFRLPPLGTVETRTYITLMLVSLSLDNGDPKFVKLIELTRDVLKRPWGGDGFNRERIKEVLGDVPSTVEDALQLADQIAPLLTDGAHGNPRQIKRFLNTMSLRMAIAEQRGIADEIKRPILAKLMLAERFETRLFEQIEREASVGGTSATVKQMETPDANKGVKKAKGKSKGQSVSDTITHLKVSKDQDGTDWAANEWVRRWASVSPKFGDTDLRPYLFVSRDKKALFNDGSTLAAKEELVKKLGGSQLGARSAAEQVAKLSPGEIEQIFDNLARNIQSVSDLKTKPDGIDGIKELCKVSPALQTPTIALLASLPTSALGPWVAAGWNKVITQSGARSELNELMQEWASQDDNKALKQAAGFGGKGKGA